MRRKDKFGVLALTGFLIIFTFIFSSCRSVYIPNMINTPLLTQKGEFKATGSFGYNGYNSQLAYALTNSIGIITNGSYNKAKFFGTENDYREFYLYDIGAGYYNKLYNKNSYYEIYMGGGQGRANIYEYSLSSLIRSSGSYSRVFGQGGIGVEDRFVGGGFALRVSVVNMKLLDPNNLVTGRYTNLYIDPVVTCKAGYNKVKVIIQAGMSYRLGEQDRANA